MGKQAEHEWGMGGAGGGAAKATGGKRRAPLRQLHDVWICNEKAAVTVARASHRPWRVVARLALARPGENSQLCLDSEGLFTFAHGLEHFGHRPGHHAGRRRRAAGSPWPAGFRAGVDGLIAEDCVSFPGARLAVDEKAAVDTVEQVADSQVGAAGSRPEAPGTDQVWWVHACWRLPPQREMASGQGDKARPRVEQRRGDANGVAGRRRLGNWVWYGARQAPLARPPARKKSRRRAQAGSPLVLAPNVISWSPRVSRAWARGIIRQGGFSSRPSTPPPPSPTSHTSGCALQLPLPPSPTSHTSDCVASSAKTEEKLKARTPMDGAMTTTSLHPGSSDMMRAVAPPAASVPPLPAAPPGTSAKAARLDGAIAMPLRPPEMGSLAWLLRGADLRGGAAELPLERATALPSSRAEVSWACADAVVGAGAPSPADGERTGAAPPHAPPRLCPPTLCPPPPRSPSAVSPARIQSSYAALVLKPDWIKLGMPPTCVATG
eukprot:scaffold6593_cov100-Isochrysis_galbana.AAC.3